MLRTFTPQQLCKMGLFVTSVAAASVLFAGCQKKIGVSTDINATLTASPEVSTAPESTPSTNPPVTETTVKAQSTQQAVTNEGTDLNRLNQKATAVDQSFTDQSIDVNK